MSEHLEEKTYIYEIKVKKLTMPLIEEIAAFIKTHEDVINTSFLEARLSVEISNLDEELALETKEIIEDFIEFVGAK